MTTTCLQPKTPEYITHYLSTKTTDRQDFFSTRVQEQVVFMSLYVCTLIPSLLAWKAYFFFFFNNCCLSTHYDSIQKSSLQMKSRISSEASISTQQTADPQGHTTSSSAWLVTPGSILSFLCFLHPMGFNGPFVQTQTLHVFPQAISLLGSLWQH